MLIEITVSRDELDIIRQYQEQEGTASLNEAASLLFRDLIRRAVLGGLGGNSNGNGSEPEEE